MVEFGEGMATHSGILAWRNRTGKEPWSTELQRVRHNWSNLARMHAWLNFGTTTLTTILSFVSYFSVSFSSFVHFFLSFFLQSVSQFSRSVVSDSLRPHESQHIRPPYPPPPPEVYSNSRPLSRWCHPAVSSSVIPFSSCPQSLLASVSFPMRQLFASGGQSIAVSASASVLPMNTQDWSPSGWTGWISLQCKGLSRVCSNTTVQKHQFFSAQLSHIHTWPLEKP